MIDGRLTPAVINGQLRQVCMLERANSMAFMFASLSLKKKESVLNTSIIMVHTSVSIFCRTMGA